MQTKLTLRLDDALIRSAKRHAAESGKSVSKLVADYFALIDSGDESSGVDLTPRVRSLLGSLPTLSPDRQRPPPPPRAQAPVRVLFDTNVVLDVLLAREPYSGTAARLFSLVDTGKLAGSVCASTVTTVYYVAAKSTGSRQAKRLVHELLDLFDLAPVDRVVLETALRLDFADYEDAVVHEAARACGATGIVTRNGKDFARAALPVFSPDELLSAIVAAE